MVALVVILSIICVCCIVYLVVLKYQIRRMTDILDDRVDREAKELLNIELVNRDLERLAASINRSFKAEEELRLKGVREENNFKKMIADISHDLRTPLTAINGYQQLLARGELNEKQREQLKVAMQYTDKLGILIEHFFEYSYLVNGKSEPVYSVVNLTAMLEECLVGYVTELEDKNIMLNYTETQQCYIMADKTMISRILENLMRNCIEHSKGNIDIKLRKKNEKSVIVFSNEIDENDNISADKLFDRFYMGDESRRRSGGLGLSIVKLLTEQQNGSVNAEIADGKLVISISFNTAAKNN